MAERVKIPGKYLPMDRVVVSNDYPFFLEMRNVTTYVCQVHMDGQVTVKWMNEERTLHSRWLSHAPELKRDRYEAPPRSTELSQGDECDCPDCTKQD